MFYNNKTASTYLSSPLQSHNCTSTFVRLFWTFKLCTSNSKILVPWVGLNSGGSDPLVASAKKLQILVFPD